MAYCSKCGKKLSDDAEYCFSCGISLIDKDKDNRNSLDIYISANVVLQGEKEQSTKADFYLRHLDKTVSVNIPNTIAVGQQLRLRGMGLSSGDKKGDLYIRIMGIGVSAKGDKFSYAYERQNFDKLYRGESDPGQSMHSEDTPILDISSLLGGAEKPIDKIQTPQRKNRAHSSAKRILVIVLAACIALGLLVAGIYHNEKMAFVWLDTGLSTKLPEIRARRGNYWKNSDYELDIRIEKRTYEQFENYVSACKEMGYTVDAQKDTDSYKAYNAEGYYLELQYWGYGDHKGPMDIQLQAPTAGDRDFSWPSGTIATIVPRLEYSSGKIVVNSEEELKMSFYGFTITDFAQYVERCKNAGFKIDVREKQTDTLHTFEAYNSEGYRIYVSMDHMEELIIHMRAPRDKNPIVWPNAGPAYMLPKPERCVGEVVQDTNTTFSVYISDMSMEDYNSYVEACLAREFVKTLRTDQSFLAERGKNISLTVEYVGFHTVYISISDFNKY